MNKINALDKLTPEQREGREEILEDALIVDLLRAGYKITKKGKIDRRSIVSRENMIKRNKKIYETSNIGSVTDLVNTEQNLNNNSTTSNTEDIQQTDYNIYEIDPLKDIIDKSMGKHGTIKLTNPEDDLVDDMRKQLEKLYLQIHSLENKISEHSTKNNNKKEINGKGSEPIKELKKTKTKEEVIEEDEDNESSQSEEEILEPKIIMKSNNKKINISNKKSTGGVPSKVKRLPTKYIEEEPEDSDESEEEISEPINQKKRNKKVSKEKDTKTKEINNDTPIRHSRIQV